MKKADMLLLTLCVTATVYGIVVISSATNYVGNTRYILVQTAALIIGVVIYVLFTLVDVDIIAERRELLLIFCVLFIAMLPRLAVTTLSPDTFLAENRNRSTSPAKSLSFIFSMVWRRSLISFMSGSGSTVFGIFEERDKALQAQGVLASKWESVIA